MFEHEVFLFDLEFGLSMILFLFFLFDFFFFGVVGWGDLEDRVDDHIKIFILFPGIQEQLLVDFVEGSRVYFGRNGGVLFGPVFEDVFEVGTSLGGLLQF